MSVGVLAISAYCAAVMAICLLWRVKWTRALIAAAIGGLSPYFSYGIAFDVRIQHDMKLSPHDGQSGMDVLAFAILAAPTAATVTVLLFLWITRRRRTPNKR
jgi:glucan phosphoethanolaminetransferase (alkaline phosphatase superfamily)